MLSIHEEAPPLTPIYSSLGGDPDLGELVELYVQEMPQRIAELARYLESGDLAEVRRIAHQMKGSSGSYGFHQLSPLAATLEQTVSQRLSGDAIRFACDALFEACRRIRPGAPT